MYKFMLPYANRSMARAPGGWGYVRVEQYFYMDLPVYTVAPKLRCFGQYRLCIISLMSDRA